VRGQGEEWLIGNVKMMTMSAVDFPQRVVRVRAAHRADVGLRASSAPFLGVRSPGTAYVLLHHYMGDIDGSYRAWGPAQGGTGAVADAIAAAARELGVRDPRQRVRSTTCG
jgi:phytoene dehydrogenase-like protein